MAAVQEKVSTEVLERLFDMRDRLKKERAVEAFRSAMTAFQAECPIIVKSKAVKNKDGKSVRYKYAPLDVIVKAVQPLLKKYGFSYVSLNTLYKQSDIITLHCPLNLETMHIINKTSIKKMKNGVMRINTSRGKLINTIDLIAALKKGKVGSAGLDVYEE